MDIAFTQGHLFSALPGSKKSRLDLGIGLDINLGSHSVVLECLYQRVFDFDNRLLEAPDFQEKEVLQSILFLITQTSEISKMTSKGHSTQKTILYNFGKMMNILSHGLHSTLEPEYNLSHGLHSTLEPE